MTGPEHYQAAENLIASVNRTIGGGSEMPLFPPDSRARLLAEAQVHATLALAAATAFATAEGLPAADWDAWRGAAATLSPEVSR